MPEKIALFYNPVAGRGLFKNKLDIIIQRFQDSGLQLIPWRISSNEQIQEQMVKLCPGEYHSIIAAGGDGTVHGVVNAMMKCGLDIPLGIFPEGTSNDLADYLKIPGQVDEYCRVITEGNLKKIDLGQVNGSYFINVASAGFITETAHEVHHELKNVLGRMAYYLKGIEKIPGMQPLQLRLGADGQIQEMEILFFMVLNGGTAGGFQGIMPGGKMNDGFLDFLAVKSVPLPRLLQLLYKFNRGQVLQDEDLVHIEGRHFTLEIDPAVISDLDGERGPDFPWEIKVCPGVLQLRTIY